MGKLACLFPGQGSQTVGMGVDLRESEPGIFERYMGQAADASGLPIQDLCLRGPIEELTRTEAAQPALFALSLAVAEVAASTGLRPDFVAGHSLGEYTAAVAAGALGTEDGMRLVARRGALMAGIQAERPGAMGAVIGLAPEDVEGLCRRVPPAAGHVAVANLNSPTQVAVSGEERAVEDLLALAREAGARRALRLPVGAAFHSSLMEPVRARLGDGMRTLRWSDAAIPLAANVSGRLIAGADEIRDALVAQIVSPVRWVDCVRGLAAAGCTAFLELGAGRVLAGLVRQIVPGADVASADSPGKLAAFAAGHGEFVTS